MRLGVQLVREILPWRGARHEHLLPLATRIGERKDTLSIAMGTQRRACRIGLAVSIVVFAAACVARDDDERVALLARDREFSNAIGDIDKVLAFYLPDASLALPGMPIATGGDDIRAAALKFGAVPGFSIEWEPDQAGVSTTRDLGFVAGTYRMTIDAQGQPSAITGHYLEVWKKSGGDWKVAGHFLHPDP